MARWIKDEDADDSYFLVDGDSPCVGSVYRDFDNLWIGYVYTVDGMDVSIVVNFFFTRWRFVAKRKVKRMRDRFIAESRSA